MEEMESELTEPILEENPSEDFFLMKLIPEILL